VVDCPSPKESKAPCGAGKSGNDKRKEREFKFSPFVKGELERDFKKFPLFPLYERGRHTLCKRENFNFRSVGWA